MHNEELNKIATLANMMVLEEQVHVLEHKVDQILHILNSKHQLGEVFGDWISEAEVMELTSLSKTTLLTLRKQGKLSSSSISGKANYYRMSQIRELLDENEKNR